MTQPTIEIEAVLHSKALQSDAVKVEPLILSLTFKTKE